MLLSYFRRLELINTASYARVNNIFHSAGSQAHNPKVAGSNPAPAIKTGTFGCLFSFNFSGIRIRTRNPQVVGSNLDVATFYELNLAKLNLFDSRNVA